MLLLEDVDIKKPRGRRGELEGNTLLWLWLISPILLVLSVQTASNTSSTWEPIGHVHAQPPSPVASETQESVF